MTSKIVLKPCPLCGGKYCVEDDEKIAEIVEKGGD